MVCVLGRASGSTLGVNVDSVTRPITDVIGQFGLTSFYRSRPGQPQVSATDVLLDTRPTAGFLHPSRPMPTVLRRRGGYLENCVGPPLR